MGKSIWFRAFLGFQKRIKLHLEPNMVLNISWEKSCEGLDSIKPAKDICAWRIRSSKILRISYLNVNNYFRKTVHLRCLTYLWNTNFRCYYSLCTFWWSESYNFWSSSSVCQKSVCQYDQCFWNTLSNQSNINMYERYWCNFVKQNSILCSFSINRDESLKIVQQNTNYSSEIRMWNRIRY